VLLVYDLDIVMPINWGRSYDKCTWTIGHKMWTFFVKSLILNQYQLERYRSTTIRKSVKNWCTGCIISIPNQLLWEQSILQIPPDKLLSFLLSKKGTTLWHGQTRAHKQVNMAEDGYQTGINSYLEVSLIYDDMSKSIK